VAQRSRSRRPSAVSALASAEATRSQISLPETPTTSGAHVAGRDGWNLRRGRKQLTRFIADGTGRTDAEVQVLIVVGAVPVLVSGAVLASRGVVRLVDFLADA
jgi:Flp pilus assembly pilin Flp